MPSDPSKTSQIPVTKLVLRKDLWPRFQADEDRIAFFIEQIEDGEDLPPIEVVPQSDGKYLIADGVHRSYAAVRIGCTDVPAIVVVPLATETVEACVYRRALETATRTALPLTNAERRQAVLKLAAESALSDRAIARLVGVSHNSVGRWKAAAEASTGSTQAGSVQPSVETISRRLATYLVQIDEGRGLLDLLVPQRVGKHLADGFTDRFGESAMKELERVRAWVDAASEHLRATS
jgi:ParB-like chromosome segregation protein Spo0J